MSILKIQILDLTVKTDNYKFEKVKEHIRIPVKVIKEYILSLVYASYLHNHS